MFKKTEKDIRAKQVRVIRYKSMPVKIENVNEQSMVVSGYLASFNTVDDVNDRLLKGCFAKSISEHGPGSKSNRKIAFCWQHKMDTPIGQFTVLKEDETGLYFEAKLDDIPFVRETVIPQYKSGTLNQHSIGYWYVKADWVIDNTYGDVFDVSELALIEGSTVTAGCNENTPFLGFKDFTMDEIANLQKQLSKLTKPLKKDLQLQIKQLFDSLILPAEDTQFEPPTLTDKPSNKKSINQFFKNKKQ